VKAAGRDFQGGCAFHRNPAGEFFLVEIADNGGGIPSEAQPHIFLVPFFTTKGGSGTGLGLVISHRIVTERHRGKIEFSTGPDGHPI
jgi:signal transduction histidine kinase